MKCGLEYCIYNKNLVCIIEPEINSFGMCDACIMVALNKDYFDKEKENQLMELKGRWGVYTDDNKR